MAKAPDKKPRRSAGFLCCFGVSRKDEKFSEKISSVNKVVEVEVESSNSGDKDKGTVPLDTATTTGLFSFWPMFRMKNSSAKTVPLDTPSDKSTDLSENNIHSSKSSNSFKPKWKIHRLFKKRTNSTTKTMPFREIKTLVKEEMIEEVRKRNYLFMIQNILFLYLSHNKWINLFGQRRDPNKTTPLKIGNHLIVVMRILQRTPRVGSGYHSAAR